MQRDGGDSWTQTVVLSSAYQCAPELLTAVATEDRFGTAPFRTVVLTRLATMIGAKADHGELAKTLQLAAADSTTVDCKLAVLDGLGRGLQNGRQSFAALWSQPPADLAEALRRARPLFERAAADARSVPAMRLLAHAPFEIAAAPLAEALGPQHAPDLQAAALRSLAAHNHPDVATILLERWDGYSPTARREAVEVLCARPDRLAKLLDAIEATRVLPAQIDPARRDLLRRHSNVSLRRRATSLLSPSESSSRAKLVTAYRDVLDLPADSTRGAAVFQAVCSTCHRLDNVGHEVGADLRAALGNKTAEALLIDILDPNREVDPRYVVYQATTTAGRSLTGILAVETPASITLRRADRSEDTILRSQLESLTASTVSLMPEELEKQLSKQQLADVIAYLLAQGKSRSQ
jgi:putative heme-binding domain-containing protein